MSYWDGTRWLPHAPEPASAGSDGNRLTGAALEASLIALLLLGIVAGSALAAKGGNGHGGAAALAATCVVDGSTVSATGLPTGEVINFMVSTADGTSGWVLGFSGDGTWSEPVPPRDGATTYEFVSRTWGPNGSHYTVFARCSAE